MKAVLIVPALNEAAVVGDLVRRTPRDIIAEVIVVDNGSTDATATVARDAGARVVHEPRRGYGAACFAGVVALKAGALPEASTLRTSVTAGAHSTAASAVRVQDSCLAARSAVERKA